MKRLTLPVGFLLASTLLASCGGGSPDKTAKVGPAAGVLLFGTQTSRIMTYEQFVATLHQEDAPDGPYIIDYDIPVVPSEKHLKELYDKYLESVQPSGGRNTLIVDQAFGADNIWDPTARRNLTYCISNAFGTRKQKVKDTLALAAAAWQAEADVKFVYVAAQDVDCRAGNHNVVFDVRPVTSGKYLARAFFPNDARRYRNLMIDNTAFVEDATNTLEGTLTHELGHALGFRHEHTRPESRACFEDNEWRALTAYDAYSVMHYPQCNGKGTNLKLTNYDRTGVRAVYGAPGSGTTGTPKTESFTGHLTKGTRAYHGPFPVKQGSNLKVVVTGSGDVDLYVRWSGKPTVSAYNCRPYLEGSDETCSLTGNGSDAYVMVLAALLSDYELTVTYVPR